VNRVLPVDLICWNTKRQIPFIDKWHVYLSISLELNHSIKYKSTKESSFIYWVSLLIHGSLNCEWPCLTCHLQTSTNQIYATIYYVVYFVTFVKKSSKIIKYDLVVHVFVIFFNWDSPTGIFWRTDSRCLIVDLIYCV
jgi:hypothetical protein